MIKVKLEDAEGHLGRLIEEAVEGEEVVITRGDGLSFKIVPLTRPRPRFGSAEGMIRIADDFDEPLPDFAEYEP